MSSSTQTSSNGITHYLDVKPPRVIAGNGIGVRRWTRGRINWDSVNNCEKEE